MSLLRTLALLVGALLCAPGLMAQTAATSPTDPPGGLVPGDAVKLAVWREPDLSGEFQVQETGDIVFPKIGAVRVTELSPDSLRETLLQKYSVYLRNPSIEVTILRRVRVVGAVRTPGLYLVDPTITLAGVVAKAGGATPQGKTTEFELRRDGKRYLVAAADARVVELPLRSGDELHIPERSWISRNTWLVVAIISAGTSLYIATNR
jgi:polysaccharide export outer membrane protein